MEGEQQQVIQLDSLLLCTITRIKAGVNDQLDIKEINSRHHETPGDNTDGISTIQRSKTKHDVCSQEQKWFILALL